MKALLQAWRANGATEFLLAAGIVLGALLALAALRFAVSRTLEALAARAATPVHQVAADTVGATRLWLLLPVALYFGASALELPAKLGEFVDVAATIALMAQAAAWAHRFIERWFDLKAARRDGVDGESVTALALISVLARVLVWTIALLLALNHLGVNITALIAGLGIGGVAVALALQNVLGDLLASLSIVLDKPFVVGDFIVVGDSSGVVERVGIKTTRIRSLDGDQLIVPNGDLLKSRIRNFKRMSERRVLFTIGVAYETPVDKLARAPAILRAIVEAQPKTRFERAHFRQYGDAALLLEVVYFVLDSDYGLYMDTQQAINLEICRRFRGEGIAFAYPTQTLYVRPAAEATASPSKSAGTP
jgi:small-conductance mechanosensitive channel